MIQSSTFLGLDTATWQLIAIGVGVVGGLFTAAWYIAKFEQDNEAPEAPDYKNDTRKFN